MYYSLMTFYPENEVGISKRDVLVCTDILDTRSKEVALKAYSETTCKYAQLITSSSITGLKSKQNKLKRDMRDEVYLKKNKIK